MRQSGPTRTTRTPIRKHLLIMSPRFHQTWPEETEKCFSLHQVQPQNLQRTKKVLKSGQKSENREKWAANCDDLVDNVRELEYFTLGTRTGEERIQKLRLCPNIYPGIISSGSSTEMSTIRDKKAGCGAPASSGGASGPHWPKRLPH